MHGDTTARAIWAPASNVAAAELRTTARTLWTQLSYEGSEGLNRDTVSLLEEARRDIDDMLAPAKRRRITYCEDCEYLHPQSKGHPRTWMCLRQPRLEGYGFVTSRAWDSFPPYMYCAGINGGACDMWEPKRCDGNGAAPRLNPDVGPERA